MSLATLARKTKAKQRLRTRGNFILNMTGRGHVLGMNAKMSRGNCKGLTKCAGKRAACCGAGSPCVPLNNQDNNFTVGNAGTFWGFDGAGGTGNLVPNTIDGSGVEWMGWQTGGSFKNQFYINLQNADPTMLQNHFDSISFINCNNPSIRTYYTTDAAYLPVDLSGGVGRPTWRWDASSNPVPAGGGFSGYTIAQENAYWQGVSGETLKMYIDTVPNVEDICCPRAPCCRFPHGGKPAPQMGYRVYLNRKSKGAYRPAGGKQCKTLLGCERAKTVWKQGSNLDASVVITNKKDKVLACNSDVYTAKRDTCTGCQECDENVRPDNNLTVENIGLVNVLYGFSTSPSSGAFVPSTINGALLNAMYWNEGGVPLPVFSMTVNGVVAQTLFTSISFINCDNKAVRTYNSTDASFNNPGGLFSTWTWDVARSGFTAVDELAYWSGAVGKTLPVFIDNPNPNFCCGCKCCPVKKNICGCRATDLVRYTRINKSFGCQTTKAIRQSRTASEQIARNRAKVDCIKPKHRTIFINVDASGNISFDGCCGDQCLIPGQQYTFSVTNVNDAELTILWCIGLSETFLVPQASSPTIVTFNVPKFNTSSNCRVPTHAVISNDINDSLLRLDYCKQAFKKPQMLGSCSGR